MQKLLIQYRKLKRDFMELVMKSDEICHYCKNNIVCKGKECDKYCEGVGVHGKNRDYYDFTWSCKNLDFGTCPKLENTLCNGCFENNNKGFEWRGSI